MMRQARVTYPLFALGSVAVVFACGGTTPAPADPTDAGQDGTTPVPTTTGVVTVPTDGSIGCGKSGVTPGFSQGLKLTVTSRARTYAVGVPDTYDATKAYPLVFVFHGDGGTGAQVRSSIKLEEASGGNAIVVYPDGLNKTWNLDSAPTDNPDADLFDALVTSISETHCVDKKRIFVTGFSRGGYFANQLACWKGDVIRAAASNGSGGPYGAAGAKYDAKGNLACPTPGVPTIIFHGQNDSPTEGQKTLDHFARANECPDKTKTSDVAPSPCKSVDGCAAGKPVVWCLVPGLGHTMWPESHKATWDFFSKL
jgi:polyhydroxybutyrate depolymerase